MQAPSWKHNHYLLFHYSYRIAKLDKRIGNCTVLACNKWQPIFSECEAALGFSGDAANDVMSAWSKLARDSFQANGESSTMQILSDRRSNSLTGMYGRTVKMPVDLIPLERARARSSVLGNETTVVQNTSLKSRRFLSQSSDSVCACSHPKSNSKPEISEPLNLEESVYTAHLSGGPITISPSPYAPQADANPLSMSRRPHSDPEDSMSGRGFDDTLQAESQDVKSTIRTYVDKVKCKRYFSFSISIGGSFVPSPMTSFSLVSSPRMPPGKKQSSERSRISSPKSGKDQ